MKTDDWIACLATGAGPAPRHRVAQRLGLAAGAGLLASAALALGCLGLNGALCDDWPALGLKLAYLGALAGAALRLLDRLARPAASSGPPLAAMALVLVALAALSALALATQPAEARAALLWGSSWSSCAALIALLGLPALGATLWALRGLAPTRPRLAGAGAGLAAGVLGALGYTLHCGESSPLFLLAWYTLGIAGLAALGTALGPRCLRW